MLNAHDQQNLTMSRDSAIFLARHLQSLTQSADPLLSDIALELQRQSLEIEQRLNRIVLLTCSEEKAAV